MGFMIFRLIIFIAIVWLGLRLLKAYNQNKQAKQSATTTTEDDTPEQMVQCRFCNLHLPQKDAIQHEHLWFCCHEHRDHFLEHGPEKR